MFRTEFSLHVSYKNGTARFSREEQLPFPPFIGLVVLDDVLGEFKVRHVAWASHCQMFLCQSQVKMDHLAIGAVASRLKKAGWVEDTDAREPHTVRRKGQRPSGAEDD